MRTSRSFLAAVVVALAAWAPPSSAWIWPEHRDIAVEAIQGLPPGDRAALDRLWNSLLREGGPQLCPSLVNAGAAPDGKFGEWKGACLDFAAYPALGGDHSCSTAELRAVTESEPWGLKVAWVAEWTKKNLAAAPDEGRRTDAWNQSHLAMQYVDPSYLTRAAGNNAHFLQPRLQVAQRETLDGYVARALAPEAPVNASAIYVQFHALALRLAAQYREAKPEDRPDLARRALLSEGIALHFLEDSFSSGHYAATWGSAPWQKGTHDLYCVIGLTSMTWGGELFASHGDAHMRDEDRRTAATGVRRSLQQLTAVLDGKLAVSPAPLTAAERNVEQVDFCKATTLPAMPVDPPVLVAARDTLRETPVPSGDQGEIHPPRARADIGPFIGVVSGITAGPALGGFETTGGWRFRSELEVGARVGYGLQGVLTTSMDGQLWGQASFVSDPAQLDASCPGCPGGVRNNQAIPRVPARSGLKLALRMPYYVLPFDLVLLAPTLFLASPTALQDVVFAATGGGLLTIQRPISTTWGTFQFMAGREVGITFWGSGDSPDQFIATPDGAPRRIVNFEQLELDFPVAEWVPPRAFATTLSLAAEVQLGFTVLLNGKTWTPDPSPAAYPGLAPSWWIYLRLRLDARKYFGGSTEDWQN